jgi:tetratricopeptide (TPR) repeat protein
LKSLCVLLLTALLAAAQRAKPVFDPETKEGLLIQHIQQERDRAEKLRYLEQFAVQFPTHPAIAWVYDQLQPVYLEVKEYDQAMRLGGLLLAIEPGNIEAAKIALRAAEGKRDPQTLQRWAERSWDIAAKRPQDPEAKQLQVFAEFCLHAAAIENPDAKARIALLQNLDRRNPRSAFAASLPGELYQAYVQAGENDRAIDIADRALHNDPNNVDMLLAVAQHHFRREDARDRDKVVQYTTQLVRVLETKPRPEYVKEEDWAARKAQVLGMANYMGGVSSSLLNQHGKADTMLRAALPYIKDNQPMLAAALYLLGLANYRLAESGVRGRAVDALRFTRQCAAIRSSYQEQALKNIEAIKSEYNLQ